MREEYVRWRYVQLHGPQARHLLITNSQRDSSTQSANYRSHNDHKHAKIHSRVHHICARKISARHASRSTGLGTCQSPVHHCERHHGSRQSTFPHTGPTLSATHGRVPRICAQLAHIVVRVAGPGMRPLTTQLCNRVAKIAPGAASISTNTDDRCA